MVSVPDATILEADGSTADLTATFTGFSSGTGTAIVADSSYAQALEVTVADGYAPGALNLAQLFITELSSLDSYDEFLFKVKGLTDNNLVLKVEPPAGTSVAIDLAAPGAGITVEELGDGWFQVVVSLAPFGDLSGANQVILQTLDNAYALGDTFLLTDIGFSSARSSTVMAPSSSTTCILRVMRRLLIQQWAARCLRQSLLRLTDRRRTWFQGLISPVSRRLEPAAVTIMHLQVTIRTAT